MNRLFVYGTLAPGMPNHHVLENIPGRWEEATLKGKLVNEGWGADYGCPGIVPGAEGTDVSGFVFSSGQLEQHWAMLDEYEGSGYERVPVLVYTREGVVLDAYVYALSQYD